MMTTLRSARAAMSGSEVTLDQLGDVFLAAQTDDRLGELAFLEEQQRGNTTDGIPLRDRGILVHVQLRNRRTSVELCCERVYGRAQPTTRTTPLRPEVHEHNAALLLIIEVAVSERLDLFGCHALSPLPLSLNPHAASRALVNVNVLPCRRVPRKILTHPCLLDASPERSVAKRGQRPSNRTEERLRRVLDESKPGAPARLWVYIKHRIVQPTRSPDDWDRPITQAVHLIQAARLETGRHQENIRTALDEMCQRLIKPNPRRDRCRVPRRQIAPHILVPTITSTKHDNPGAELRQLTH